MFTIRKKFTFEAAHQLETAVTAACHECVHGHSYTVEVYVQSPSLNKDGMVIDFAEFKEFKDEVMEDWDHGVLFHKNKRDWMEGLVKDGVWKRGKVHFLDDNPTAEYMAMLLWMRLRDFLKAKGAGVYAKKVRIHETSTGWAEFESEASV